ncbi:unnamed protein product [Toxocara canis]|uniref:Phospholipase A2 n=1 Tax=Toxocara canis TaxID=6265 RepID=A0A183TUX8_TOXCA|nr:unnamed protein product [Toxocara canis]
MRSLLARKQSNLASDEITVAAYLNMYNAAVIIVASTLFVHVLSSRNVSIRALWNLEAMCECKLDYTALTYSNYGCWCGIGGGGEPVDGIDRCCMLHDKCYDAAVERKECFDVFFEYIEDYSWHCVDKEPVCKESTSNGCQSALCECDKSVVDCWAQFAKPTARVKCNRTKAPLHSSFVRFFNVTDEHFFV